MLQVFYEVYDDANNDAPTTRNNIENIKIKAKI
jgi:hypothetical protein